MIMTGHENKNLELYYPEKSQTELWRHGGQVPITSDFQNKRSCRYKVSLYHIAVCLNKDLPSLSSSILSLYWQIVGETYQNAVDNIFMESIHPWDDNV